MMRSRAGLGVSRARLSRLRGWAKPSRMDAKTQRDKRLAAALRDNLRRRKAPAQPETPLAQPAERDGEAEEDGDQR